MGKNVHKVETVNISIWIKPEILSALDKIATKLKITRSKLIQNLINVGLDEIKLQNNIGLVKVSLTLRDLKDTLIQAEKPQKTKKGSNTSIGIKKKTLKEIESYAGKFNMTRSKLIEYIIDLAYRDVLFFEKIKLISAVGWFRESNARLSKLWKKRFKEASKVIEIISEEKNQ